MRQIGTMYPVRDVLPAGALNGGHSHYLHVVASYPDSTPPVALLTTRHKQSIAPLSIAHQLVRVPVDRTGYPHPERIDFSPDFRPEGHELEALGILAAQEKIRFTYVPDSDHMMVTPNRSIVQCETADGAVLFCNVSARSIMLAGFRAFAEQRP